jgi:hypothetical protein
LYSKNNYAEILPLKLAAIFMKQFETMMDSLLNDEANMAKFKELFKVQLAVANSSVLESIKQRDKETVDENSKYAKYVTNTEDIYSDFHGLSVLDDKGNVDHSATIKTFPEYVKSSFTDEKTNKETTRIYRRVDYQKGDNKVHYQLVSRDTRSNTYSVGQQGSESSYDINEAFRPDIRNIQVKNPKSNILETSRVLKVGDAISLTSYTDAARQYKIYYEVTKKVKIKDSDKFKYTLEAMELYDFEYEDREALSIPKELKRIKEETDIYNEVIDSLLKRKSILSRVINKNYTQEDAGLTYKTVNSNLELSINTSYNPNKITDGKILNEIIIHEEIHRYTSSLLDFFAAFSEEKSRALGVSEAEIQFAKEIIELYNQYIKSSHIVVDTRITDPSEFLAYGLTSPSVIKDLKSIMIENKSILTKLIEILTKLFGGNISMHSALQTSFDNLMKTDELKFDTELDSIYSEESRLAKFKSNKFEVESAQETINKCGM